jgi:acetoin utilization protein AcuC
MTREFGIVYNPKYSDVKNPPNHPLQGSRYLKSIEFFEEIGLLSKPNIKLIDPEPATTDEILLAHTKDHLKLVKRLSELGKGQFDPDTPVYKGIYEVALLTTGGSLTAMRSVLRGDVECAMNLSGGFHHAKPDQARGYCIFNDVNILGTLLRDEGFHRVLYVEIDAHFGDGTYHFYKESPKFFTLSFHESGESLYPYSDDCLFGEGEGYGYHVNVPLPIWTDDNAFLYAFQSIFLPIVSSYKPEFIIFQSGVDGHCRDWQSHLLLTKKVYLEVARMIRSVIDSNETKLIVLGGGGYDPMAAALCWASVINELAELKLDLTSYNDECEKEPYEDSNVIEKIKQIVTKLTSAIHLEKSENI